MATRSDSGKIHTGRGDINVRGTRYSDGTIKISASCDYDCELTRILDYHPKDTRTFVDNDEKVEITVTVKYQHYSNDSEWVGAEIEKSVSLTFDPFKKVKRYYDKEITVVDTPYIIFIGADNDEVVAGKDITFSNPSLTNISAIYIGDENGVPKRSKDKMKTVTIQDFYYDWE